MNTQDFISKENFLDKKLDYSPFLIHLTRDSLYNFHNGGNDVIPAREVLDTILKEHTLKAQNYFCLFERKGVNPIDSLDETTKSMFKVVCFTETPIGQIEVLLKNVEGRTKKFEPYGLVFTKDYIREKVGNPVFYCSDKLFDTLWQIYNSAASNNFSKGENKFLALINKYDKSFDFHWEREWRIVGDFVFKLNEIFCGLCPEAEIPYFENKYTIIFIDPHWGINKILDKMVKTSSNTSDELPF